MSTNQTSDLADAVAAIVPTETSPAPMGWDEVEAGEESSNGDIGNTQNVNVGQLPADIQSAMIKIASGSATSEDHAALAAWSKRQERTAKKRENAVKPIPAYLAIEERAYANGATSQALALRLHHKPAQPIAKMRATWINSDVRRLLVAMSETGEEAAKLRAKIRGVLAASLQCKPAATLVTLPSSGDVA